MKYEWIITGQEFFRWSVRQDGMPYRGMRNLQSQNNVGQWNKGRNDVREVLKDRSEGEEKRSG